MVIQELWPVCALGEGLYGVRVPPTDAKALQWSLKSVSKASLAVQGWPELPGRVPESGNFICKTPESV